MKTLSENFFLRPGFEGFQLAPEDHAKLLIGEHDRRHRDKILEALEDDCSSGEGYKAVIYGDFGRGKTHEARNIQWELENQKVPVYARLVTCHEFKAKESFSSLFAMMLQGLGAKEVNRVAEEYLRRARDRVVPAFEELVQTPEIAIGLKALANANIDTVRVALQWLGGIEGVDTKHLGTGLPDRLTVSREFAEVMGAMARMFKVVDNRVLVFFVDEAERFSLVTHTDTYWSWVGCLRALTEIRSVGFVFYVGAQTRDDLPNMLTWDEVYSRIGTQNYKQLFDPGPDELKQWVEELFQTLVRKGDVPVVHCEAVPPAALDDAIPDDLKALVGKDPKALAAYPFTPAALKEFVDACVSRDLGNRPRAVLKLIQAAAKRANRLGLRLIDETIVREIGNDV